MQIDPRTGRMIEPKLTITDREYKTIKHALLYMREPYGCVGHNLMALVAKFAEFNNFVLTDNNVLILPDDVDVEKTESS